MQTRFQVLLVAFALSLYRVAAPASLAADQVKVAGGIVEGTTEASGVRAFKGIPFA